jgi:hypothetical protein
LPGNVNEHRTAAAGDAGPGIVVDLDNQVVKPVGAAKPVAWFTGRAPERPIVAAIPWILAPCEVRPDPPHWKRCARPLHAVGSPPQAKRMKSAGRRSAVALTLIGLDAATAKCNPYGAGPSNHEALRAAARTRAYPDQPK